MFKKKLFKNLKRKNPLLPALEWIGYVNVV